MCVVAAKSYLRPIDCINAKAIPVPITLYTFDIAFDGDNLRAGFLEPQLDANGKQPPESGRASSSRRLAESDRWRQFGSIALHVA